MSLSKTVKSVGQIVAALVLTVSFSSVSQAQFKSAAIDALASEMADQSSDDEYQALVHNSAMTLDEALSPDELAEQLNPVGDLSDIFYAAKSAYTDRLLILVNKAQRGQSPTAQQMYVYLDGQLLYTFPVSTGREKPEIAKSGRAYFSATPVGDFRILRRDKKYFSTTWQAPMPFAQFFNGGVAIHATTPSHYPELGTRDSGGCVRLRYENAQLMWNLVDQVGVNNVKIRVINQAY